MGKGAPSRRAHHSLSKRTLDVFHISTPVGSEQATFDKAMKAAMRPVRDARYVTMLDGIKVNVIDVTLEVDVVTNRMLPVAALPNTLLAVARRYRAKMSL